MQTLHYTTHDLPIQASLWCPAAPIKRPTIIYIHGGGLIYGNRDDLPQSYIDAFLAAGYPLLALDYCLAPESDHATTMQSLQDGLQFFTNHYTDWQLPSDDYVLFGRSAGAYLSCQLLLMPATPRPKAFVDFYGFATLTAPSLQRPNQLYNSYPKVSDQQANELTQSTPLTGSTIDSRFLLYVYARQTQRWATMSLRGSSDHVLDAKTAQTFPPTYICHSTADPDVPFGNAITLKAKLPEATLITVSTKAHDFDRTVTADTNLVYQKLITWLDATVTR